MEAVPLEMIVETAGGKLLKGDRGTTVSGIVTDSRAACAGALFAPLAGEHFDGHDFIGKAAAAGAVGTLASREAPPGLPEYFAVVRVEDTMAAYQAIGRANRKRYEVPVVAITGSCGKTTTKNLLANILFRKNVVRTEQNENNEIGVPKTLLRMDGSTEAAVIEFGMRGPGEIAQLAGISLPTHGIITNIEPTHIGRLGSLEAIADAKGELLEFLGPNEKAFLNADNPWTPRLRSKTRAEIITFGVDSGDVRVEGIAFEIERVDFTLLTPIGRIESTVPFPGRGTVYNAAAAAAAAISIGLSIDDIAEGLARPIEESGRMRSRRTPDGKLILDDTYNSSPASLRQALELLGSVKWDGRRVAVLGDMLELGDHSRDEHFKAGRDSVARNADLLVTFGPEARHIAEGAAEAGWGKDRCFSYEDFESFEGDAGRLFKPGDLILVKGSRGMKMEQIVGKIGDTS